MTNTKDKSESNYQALLKELQASKDHFQYIRKKDGKALDDALAQVVALQADLDAANEEIELFRRTFHHFHINRQDGTDTCKECGLDLRNPIHFTPTDKEQSSD